jgi:hypothetical protein
MLKIDLYNNHEVFIKESRQDRAIDAFCRRHKISRSKLEQHPYLEDVHTMLKFDQWQSLMTAKDRQIWTHAWQHLYHRERALTEYLQRKLISIVEGIEFRQQRLKHIQARQQRKAASIAR